MYQNSSLCISGDFLWAYCILKIKTKKIAWYQMQHAYCILHTNTSNLLQLHSNGSCICWHLTACSKTLASCSISPVVTKITGADISTGTCGKHATKPNQNNLSSTLTHLAHNVMYYLPLLSTNTDSRLIVSD